MSDSYTAQDTIALTDYNGQWILADFANGTVAELSAPNELSTMTTGYNGNGLGSHNEPGRQREFTIRIIKGSADDKRLNTNYTLWKNRDIRFKPLQGVFTKNVAHSDGSMTNDTVECFFGLPAAQPTQMMDTEGNTDQVVSVYMFRFANSNRTM